jgi:putative Mn2+ efflux pump MntP
MELLPVLMLAVGLAADAFAVSVAEGVAIHKITRAHVLRVSICFGAFQALMPVAGWLAGSALARFIQPFDHWVAFGLLGFLGGKMIADSLTGFETAEPRQPSRGARLLLLAIATSLDALAVGVTLGILHTNIWAPAVIIGIVTGLLCAIGMDLGDRIGSRLGRRAELAGGVILVGIGVKILVEHFWFTGGGA